MNHVVRINVWLSRGNEGAELSILRERGAPKFYHIDDHWANWLGEQAFALVIRDKVQIYPFMCPNCYGWGAERIGES